MIFLFVTTNTNETNMVSQIKIDNYNILIVGKYLLLNYKGTSEVEYE